MSSENTISPVSGELYLISTSIGNLDDMTFRAIETLKQCDIVFAEDTRHTRILFQHFGIEARLASYHAFNEHGISIPFPQQDLYVKEFPGGAPVQGT